MRRYKIGFYSYEESEYIEFEHEQSFTKDEMTQMIGEAIVALLPVWKKNNEFIHNMEDCFWKEPSIADWLVENKGFKRIEYDLTWDIFGWASIFSKDDWDSDREASLEMNEIVDIVRKAGYSEKDDSMNRKDS